MSSEHALAELRQTTRAEHDRIDQILCLTEPMELERYAAIVSGFDAFLRVWEPRIHEALPERLQGWYRSRRRGGFATADVDWLRAEAGIDPVAMDARAAVMLPLTDLAEALGSLYVIEGSALGGRVIAPQLNRTLGLTQGAGASYFHGFGGESGVMWNNFRVLASLEIGESSRNIVRACDSARRTFQALITLFEPLAPPAPAPRVMESQAEQRIAPALLAALGADDPEATRPTSRADIPIDMPDGGDTQRRPL